MSLLYANHLCISIECYVSDTLKNGKIGKRCTCDKDYMIISKNIANTSHNVKYSLILISFPLTVE